MSELVTFKLEDETLNQLAKIVLLKFLNDYTAEEAWNVESPNT